MKNTFLAKLLILAVVFVWPASGAAGEGGPTIRLSQQGKGAPSAVFDVTGLDPKALARLAKASLNEKQWTALFAVYVKRAKDGDGSEGAVLGAYQVNGKVLRFQPRFPLVRGIRYRAVFEPKRWPGGIDIPRERIVVELTLLKARPAPATSVAQVYPTGNKLPENQLKFYIHFSAPMSQGEAYGHIKLFNAAGKPVTHAFLELREELWDPASKRFTLLFDPGRIKKGLKPREELGPVLVAGQKFTLMVDRQWPDAEGNLLEKAYHKVFTVGPAMDEIVDPKRWKLVTPLAGSRRPLVVTFGRPLDRGLLQRALWVVDAQGRMVPGEGTVRDEETRWHFTPKKAWTSGLHHLVVDTSLEDLAGNNLLRPFEVDVLRRIQKKIETKTVRVAFRVE